ncbi:hypothetical protein MZM54_02955 [[Brevibacterium] frigoritolerans]|nr:hypothetical protein [Peribacillus frigoritolerans]
MNELEQILDKYKEFAKYLEKVDLNKLRTKFTRRELDNFSLEIYSIKTRNLGYDTSKLVKEWKNEEYPELLGVHSYPIIKEIDFLTESQKLALDKHLAKMRVGNQLYGLYNVTRDSEKTKLVESFLVDNEIVDEGYYAICPQCKSSHLSGRLNKEEKEELITNVNDQNLVEREEVLEKYLEYNCVDMYCENSTDLTQMTEINFKSDYTLILERDKRLELV